MISLILNFDRFANKEAKSLIAKSLQFFSIVFFFGQNHHLFLIVHLSTEPFNYYLQATL